ncbi:MAG: PEP-CTERM sorting domain-containing protein [Acidobacteriia bacterium]|nr:PEP-CTERM sorting domain-containing protein [Terriglobia bacterium]
MKNWSVGGQDQLKQQWFWYRIGSGGVASPINSIGPASITTFLGPDGINEVVATYQNTTLTLTIDYLLSGGGVGSGSADITESISAVNNTGASLDFHFFQYSDFNLLGDGSSDNVQLFGMPGSWSFVQQTAGSSGIGEAIVMPFANHGEAAYFGTTLAELNGTSGLTLNDNSIAGPGDVTWALQWDATVPVGGMFDLTKDKSLFIQVVPEPSTVALIALGLGAWGWARRRQRS